MKNIDRAIRTIDAMNDIEELVQGYDSVVKGYVNAIENARNEAEAEKHYNNALESIKKLLYKVDERYGGLRRSYDKAQKDLRNFEKEIGQAVDRFRSKSK